MGVYVLLTMVDVILLSQQCQKVAADGMGFIWYQGVCDHRGGVGRSMYTREPRRNAI